MRAALLFATLLIAGNALAIDAERLDDPVMQARYESLLHELRCLVCQNETIADSNATLAADLRRELRDMMKAGKTDAEIRAFLTERYGDFVLYMPPVTPRTWLLWAAPALLLVRRQRPSRPWWSCDGARTARAPTRPRSKRNRTVRDILHRHRALLDGAAVTLLVWPLLRQPLPADEATSPRATVAAPSCSLPCCRSRPSAPISGRATGPGILPARPLKEPRRACGRWSCSFAHASSDNRMISRAGNCSGVRQPCSGTIPSALEAFARPTRAARARTPMRSSAMPNRSC